MSIVKFRNGAFVAMFASVMVSGGIVSCGLDDSNKASPQSVEQSAKQPETIEEIQLKKVESPNQSEVNLSNVDDLISELQTERDIQALKDEAKKETVYEADRISSKIISELLAKRFNQKIEDRLSPEEQSCFGRVHYGFGITDIDSVLRRQLSARDFNALNEFNRSAFGKKMPKYSEYLFERSSRSLSDQERRQLREFSRTKEGQYLTNLDNNAELIDILKKRTKHKAESCDLSSYDKDALYRL